MVKKGLLLVNLGTPDSPGLRDVRQYLSQFLRDPRVVGLPHWLRLFLLYFFILPFRAKRSAKAYAQIWTTQGSPLLNHSQALTSALQHKLQDSHTVCLAMRYGHPSIEDALQTLSSYDHLTILPLYPQYASASTGSSLEAILKIIGQQTFIPSLNIIHAFYDHPAFIRAQASRIAPYLPEHDFILFSYHGLPERQLIPAGCAAICQPTCSPNQNPTCYRSQCYTTTQLLANALNLPSQIYATSLQSRFGRTPWIKPYTDAYLTQLADQGIKKLLVVCPAFTADCLETLEEIGDKAHQQWLKLGGERSTLVPSLNATEEWVEAIVEIASLRSA